MQGTPETRLTKDFLLGAVAVAPHLAEGVATVIGQALLQAGVEARLELLGGGGDGLLGVESCAEDYAHEKHHDKLVECHFRWVFWQYACVVFL